MTHITKINIESDVHGIDSLFELIAQLFEIRALMDPGTSHDEDYQYERGKLWAHYLYLTDRDELDKHESLSGYFEDENTEFEEQAEESFKELRGLHAQLSREVEDMRALRIELGDDAEHNFREFGGLDID